MEEKYTLYSTFRGKEQLLMSKSPLVEIIYYLRSSWDVSIEDEKELIEVGSIQVGSGILTLTSNAAN